jgi:hypothetical protein
VDLQIYGEEEMLHPVFKKARLLKRKKKQLIVRVGPKQLRIYWGGKKFELKSMNEPEKIEVTIILRIHFADIKSFIDKLFAYRVRCCNASWI